MQGEADVFQLVKAAVEELNGELRVPLAAIEWSTPLFCEVGVLDSLGLVRLIADLEMRVEDTTGVAIVLADEKAMSRSNPYRTVGTLVELITDRMAEADV